MNVYINECCELILNDNPYVKYKITNFCQSSGKRNIDVLDFIDSIEKIIYYYNSGISNIGIINRICNFISKIAGLSVLLMYLEDKTFIYRMSIFRNNIIITCSDRMSNDTFCGRIEIDNLYRIRHFIRKWIDNKNMN